jgi:hypothetical protein
VEVQSTEFSGAAALRMSAYEKFLRLIAIRRVTLFKREATEARGLRHDSPLSDYKRIDTI